MILTHTCVLFKVSSWWLLLAIYLRRLLYAQTIFEVLEFYIKELESCHYFYHFFVLTYHQQSYIT